MNKVVALVNAFDEYEKQQEGADIADFCRYYLTMQDAQQKEGLVGGHIPPSDHALMMKLLGRLMGAYEVYHSAAMAKTQLPFREGFYILNYLNYATEVKKTDLINYLLIGYTTGMDFITKLMREGLVQEREHDTDKRAKLISLTEKGKTVLQECYPYMDKVSRMVLKGLSPNALKLCISLMSELEIKQSKFALAVRGKDFDEMFETVMNEP